MARNNTQIPSGTGGITRYFDEEKSRFEMTPSFVIILIVVIIILELLLHIYGKGLF